MPFDVPSDVMPIDTEGLSACLRPRDAAHDAPGEKQPRCRAVLSLPVDSTASHASLMTLDISL